METALKSQRIDEIRSHMAGLDTGELLSIWRDNRRSDWTDEAFEAVRLVLLARGENLPDQMPTICVPADEMSLSALGQARRPGCVTALALMLLVSGGLCALVGLAFGASETVALRDGLMALGVGALYIWLGMGLWRLRSWARVAILVSQGLGLAVDLIILFSVLLGEPETYLLHSLVGLLSNGVVVYWFTTHGELFH